MTESMINRLLKFDSCAISDALDQLNHSGVALGLQNMTVSKRIVGRAVTIQLGPADGKTSKRHLCTEAVDSSGSGDILVIAHENETNIAGWGGVLSRGAVKRSIEGVVIDGAFRDVDESKELNLPIYGKAVTPVTARGRIMEKSWGEPVTISGIRVEPGDYVVADGSGVVFIPNNMVARVLELAENITKKEQSMADAVEEGYRLSEVMGSSYEQLLQNKEGNKNE